MLNGELVTGVALGTLSNPEIKWEQQESFNVGVDARFLNNELTFTADYFSRNTKDLLLVPDISGILGGTAPGSGAPIINGGDVKNTGFRIPN